MGFLPWQRCRSTHRCARTHMSKYFPLMCVILREVVNVCGPEAALNAGSILISLQHVCIRKMSWTSPAEIWACAQGSRVCDRAMWTVTSLLCAAHAQMVVLNSYGSLIFNSRGPRWPGHQTKFWFERAFFLFLDYYIRCLSRQMLLNTQCCCHYWDAKLFWITVQTHVRMTPLAKARLSFCPLFMRLLFAQCSRK